MSLPNLNPVQVAWITAQVQTYITAQRAAYHPGALPLNAAQMATMGPFFAQNILGTTRINVLHGTHAANPPFYGQLVGMGIPAALLPNFAAMAAFTFVDTLVYQSPITNQTLFHELVHVVQCNKLGLPTFAAKYVMGFLTGGSYPNIPLEVNAYQLDSIFAAAPTVGFSVEGVVLAWINAGKF